MYYFFKSKSRALHGSYTSFVTEGMFIEGLLLMLVCEAERMMLQRYFGNCYTLEHT